MSHLRAAYLLLLFTPALAVLHAATTVGEVKFPVTRTPFTGAEYIAPVTPLAEIPVYTLTPTSETRDTATRALAAEIERLYTHAKTLPSSHERRAFETRIYLLEKRMRPLVQNFDLDRWTQLRTDVRAEWTSVQASLPAHASNS
jgi:hypothetical protein